MIRLFSSRLAVTKVLRIGVLWLALTGCGSLLSGTAQGAGIASSITATKRRVYVYEAFDVVLEIQSEGVRLDTSFDLVSLPAKTLLEIGRFQELRPERRIEGTEVFETRRYKAEARAVTPGALRISPVLEVGVIKWKTTLFGHRQVRVSRRIKVAPLTMEVLPLPFEGKPSDFSGAVGRFSMTVNVAPTNVAPGDLVVVTSEIEGAGYLRGATPPATTDAQGLKKYPPKQVSADTGHALTQTYEQIVIPETASLAEIPPVTFSFFNPSQEKYVTLKGGPFPLTFHAERPVSVEQYLPPDENKNAETAVLSPLDPLTTGDIDIDSLVRRAESAYGDGQFEAAIEFLDRVIKEAGPSASAFHNLGNAYFESGDYAQAILYYRRALRMNPWRNSSGHNLAIAQSRAGVPLFRNPFLRKAARTVPLPFWVALGAACMVLLPVMPLLRRPLRLHAAASMLSGILLVSLLAFSAWSTAVRVEDGNDAVLLRTADVYFAPFAASWTTFQLPAGSSVDVEGQHANWAKVSCLKNRGWIRRDISAMVRSPDRMAERTRAAGEMPDTATSARAPEAFVVAHGR